MSGGVECESVAEAEDAFSARRAMCEEGGSLTILATALIDTGSRMDQVIFEEFKGTGNMELHLDRSLVEKRLYPAIHILQSGTRREDLLYHPEEWERVQVLRKAMAALPPIEAMEKLIENLQATKTNAELLLSGSAVIATDSQLAELLPQLQRFDRVAVDTEADSLHCYFEKLCLIQLSFDGKDYLIDPLAAIRSGAALQPRWRKGNRAARRGFRSAPAAPQLRFRRVREFFDTVIAARLLGIARVQPRRAGAAIFRRHLAERFAEGELGAASASSARWRNTPRTTRIICFRSRQKLEEQMRALGRMEWFRAIVSSARSSRPSFQRERDEDEAWRIAGSGTLPPPDRRDPARALALARSRSAARPIGHHFTFCKISAMLEAANSICRGRNAGFSAFVRAAAARISGCGASRARVAGIGLAATAAARSVARARPGFDKKVEELRRRRDHHAKELAIEPAFIAPAQRAGGNRGRSEPERNPSCSVATRVARVVIR